MMLGPLWKFVRTRYRNIICGWQWMLCWFRFWLLVLGHWRKQKEISAPKNTFIVFLTSTHTITKTNWNEVKRHLADQSKSSVYKSDLNPSSIRKIFSLVYCSGSGSGFVPFFVFWMSKLQRQPQLLRQLLSPEVLAWKNIEIKKPLEREPRLRLCGVFWIACQYSCETKLDQLASY